MKIKTINSDETYLSRTVCYTLEINGQEREIVKKWFCDNSGLEENEWDGVEDSDREFIKSLDDEQSDELDDFISSLK